MYGIRLGVMVHDNTSNLDPVVVCLYTALLVHATVDCLCKSAWPLLGPTAPT